MVHSLDAEDRIDEPAFAVVVYRGKSADLKDVFRIHNVDTRPMGMIVRSLSVGDVVVLHGRDGSSDTVHVCCMMGWKELSGSSAEFFRWLASRGVPAHGAIRSRDYWTTVGSR